jgi:DNA-nicking Smr family endonuclease
MKDAKPLPKRRARKPPNLDTLDWDDAEDTSPVVVAEPPPPLAPAKPAARPALVPGGAGDLDKRTRRRLKRGKVEIYGRLDLHRMTQAVAHRALSRFIAASQGPERRCVLVITGKGLLKDGSGVLRQAVPRWLGEAPNRDKVLSISPAAPADGGTGALYVMLRRAK